jgi:hypothetical protein
MCKEMIMISLTQVWRISLHLLGEVATHDVLKKHLQGLKDVEININNLLNAKQKCEHTQGETFKSGN